MSPSRPRCSVRRRRLPPAPRQDEAGASLVLRPASVARDAPVLPDPVRQEQNRIYERCVAPRQVPVRRLFGLRQQQKKPSVMSPPFSFNVKCFWMSAPWCNRMPMVNTEILSPSSHAGSSFFCLMSSHGLVQPRMPRVMTTRMYEPTVAGVSHCLSGYRASLTNQSKPYVPCMPTYAHAAVVLQL
eukprot:scaffold48423_cov69-Phaeocystis_antarctica.AAC.2